LGCDAPQSKAVILSEAPQGAQSKTSAMFVLSMRLNFFATETHSNTSVRRNPGNRQPNQPPFPGCYLTEWTSRISTVCGPVDATSDNRARARAMIHRPMVESRHLDWNKPDFWLSTS
jgi:hypothetical protein